MQVQKVKIPGEGTAEMQGLITNPWPPKSSRVFIQNSESSSDIDSVVCCTGP